jgi:hypothetical protein
MGLNSQKNTPMKTAHPTTVRTHVALGFCIADPCDLARRASSKA